MGAYCRRDNDAIGTDMDHVFSLFPRLKERALQLAGTCPAANSRCWPSGGR
jgi:branched-chain amino acid transport system ATP-binding protein